MTPPAASGPGRPPRARGLVVLADGAQAAFAAAVVAGLESAGVRWARAAGAGLGAEIAAQALLGEAGAGADRWRRQAGSGCPLLTSQIAAARRLLGTCADVVTVPDAWRLSGWLDGAGLAEHFDPAAAGWPARLASLGVRCQVAVADLGRGADRWLELTDAEPAVVVPLLRAAAAFPAGWGPIDTAIAGEPSMLAGGVQAAAGLERLVDDGEGAWDLVCGFPVPAVSRPGLGTSLLEQVQRRGEVAAAASVLRVVGGRRRPARRLFAPDADLYREWARRDGADLGVEYPLPWERNGELVAAMLEFGASVASSAARG